MIYRKVQQIMGIKQQMKYIKSKIIRISNKIYNNNINKSYYIPIKNRQIW